MLGAVALAVATTEADKLTRNDSQEIENISSSKNKTLRRSLIFRINHQIQSKQRTTSSRKK
jgi:hypothetical protein